MNLRQMLSPEGVRTKLSKYRFEIRHIIVLFAVLVAFQVVLAFLQKSFVGDFLLGAQSWFQKYYAERIAIVTSSSLELLFQNQPRTNEAPGRGDNRMVTSFNVFLKQQLIQRSIEDISLILLRDGRIYLINNGQMLQAFFGGSLRPVEGAWPSASPQGLRFFMSVQDELRRHEKIISRVSNEQTFDVAVPFVPEGEYIGALYMRITPHFNFLTDEVRANFDRASLAFSALILVGLIAMFFVSSHAVRERNDMQRQFFEEHQEYLAGRIRLEKESLFTRRIYHTHHKAEKIMGFIKDDVRKMNAENLNQIRKRVITYSNFMSRIIYDMKWYDQEINTIVNPMFRTNINAVLEFIVQNVFLRLSSKNEMFEFVMKLDPTLPPINVNEFTVWEIVEPLIQNAIDHSGKHFVTITIRSAYDPEAQRSTVSIADNGEGIVADLLAPGVKGVKRIFLESETTKHASGLHSGYGCYIAHQLAVGKCGWDLDAANLSDGGCIFTLTINNQRVA